MQSINFFSKNQWLSNWDCIYTWRSRILVSLFCGVACPEEGVYTGDVIFECAFVVSISPHTTQKNEIRRNRKHSLRRSIHTERNNNTQKQHTTTQKQHQTNTKLYTSASHIISSPHSPISWIWRREGHTIDNKSDEIQFFNFNYISQDSPQRKDI